MKCDFILNFWSHPFATLCKLGAVVISEINESKNTNQTIYFRLTIWLLPICLEFKPKTKWKSSIWHFHNVCVFYVRYLSQTSFLTSPCIDPCNTKSWCIFQTSKFFVQWTSLNCAWSCNKILPDELDVVDISWLALQTRYSCSRNFCFENWKKQIIQLAMWKRYMKDNILTDKTNQILLFPELWQY